MIDTVSEPPPYIRDARRLSDHPEDGVDATWSLARRVEGVAATCGRVDAVEAVRNRVDGVMNRAATLGRTFFFIFFVALVLLIFRFSFFLILCCFKM